MPEASTDRFDLRALLETSRLLASSLDVDFVLGNLLLTAMSKLFVTRGVAMLDYPLAPGADGDGFRVEAVKGMPGLKPDDTLRLRAPDAVAQGDDVPGPLRERGVALLLPVLYHDRRIGLVGLGPKATGQPFEPGELSFVDSLVNMSATAVHNAQMVEELRDANEELGQTVQQLNTLFDLSQEFARTLDADRAVRILSLALMGQLLIRRYVLLLRPDGATEDSGLEVAAARDADDLDAETVERLGDLGRMQLLDEDAPAEWADLRERGFALALPLRMQDATRGALLLGPKATQKPYTPDDVDFLTALGQLALTAVENARGVAARVEKERLEEEMHLARSIQERLLPQQLPAVEGADLAALNLPSRFVAGDYYDALRLDDNRVLVAVADVSGKGIPASLLMANLQACLHLVAASLSAGTVDLPTATQRVNRVIHRNTGLTMFITFFWGIYDRRDGGFRFVNAGHNPPLAVRAAGGIDELQEGGVLLGVLAEAPYAEGHTTLEEGDVLVLYTDGVTEAWSATDADDEFGEERLTETVRAHREQCADGVMDALREAVRTHTGGGPLDDDLTVVVLKREG